MNERRNEKKNEREKTMHHFTNPLIWSDVPDPDVIRVGDTYYMSSTTMYFTPGCPIMKSKDLVQWEIINYVYDILEENDKMSLQNGQHDYGKGSWASSLRFHEGTYYVSFVAYNTGTTYIFKTDDIEEGKWERHTFDGIYHDMSLLFDDGKVYMVYGNGAIKIIELTADATAIKPNGLNKVLIENANVGGDGGLGAEGAHFYKVNGMYYLFLIAWPPTGSGRRIQICYRSNKVDGEYEGKVILDDDMGYQNAGVAQGGIVDTKDGAWYAMLFQDHGAVGRIPVLVPLRWEDNWPVLGVDGKVPHAMAIPVKLIGTKSTLHQALDKNSREAFDENSHGGAQYDPERSKTSYERSEHYLVTSDDFNRPTLALVWQWNHNPDNESWSLDARKGWLRLTTGSICKSLTDAKNTLTQRTFGPECTGSICIDVKNMINGDVAGLAALQEKYGLIGVKMSGGQKYIIMSVADEQADAAAYRTDMLANEMACLPLDQDILYLRVHFDFYESIDEARFYYSLDNVNWNFIGDILQMSYKLSHFTGYRFALFNYATETVGGNVDIDWFKLE